MKDQAANCCAPLRSSEAKSVAAQVNRRTGKSAAGDMVDIPAGSFTMGSDDPRGYAADGEGPAHAVELPAFSVAVTTVTNREFTRFVAATGYTTTAERFGNSFVFAGLLPDDFPPTRAVAFAPWWREVPGAHWRSPEGPRSNIDDRMDHPVVQVSWDDAIAYCGWSSTRLPSEAEWERAARGGRERHHFPWGDEREPNGEHLMNVFQGTFPGNDEGADGWVGTCPVRSFPPNGFGLYETTGNVWEWCADWFDPSTYRRGAAKAPSGPERGETRVIRGGSYLCHESYCWRYRVNSRSANTPDSTAGNVGFRVAR